MAAMQLTRQAILQQKGKEKKFQCNVCGLKFSRNPDMNRHKSSVHDKKR